ncbi:MAG: hypothetical protein M5R36_29580 [Deltaproteobacteria bacterium]|nr:hypothetical protein [Deltaproteobacteria bacterium]
MTTPVERFIEALDRNGNHPRKSGQGWTARCPAHDDHHASLSFTTGGNDGRVLATCFAGCEIEDVVSAVGLTTRDLFPANDKRHARPKHSQRDRARKVKARKTEASGVITLETLARDKGLPVDFLRSLGIRDLTNGGVEIPYHNADGSIFRKRIRTALRAKDGSCWGNGKGTCPYGLDRLSDAQEAGYYLFVEGESDVWTLLHYGFPALGFPGATSVGATLRAEHLNGVSRVFVFRESDKGGAAFVAGVARKLAELGWQGEARVISFDDAKDPNEAHLADPDGFPAKLRAAMERAEPLRVPDHDAIGEPPRHSLTTDTANAERFAHDHGADIRWCDVFGGWLVWDGIRWARDWTRRVEALVKESVRAIYREAAEHSDEDFRKRLAKHAAASEGAQRRDALLKLARSERGFP